MQTRMFVFIGVPNLKSQATISEIEERLKFEFSTSDKFEFTRKDKLLISQYNDVSYYISVLESKKELKDWTQMAKDFELSSDLTILTENSIDERYDKLRITKPGLYSETEYSIAMTIFKAIGRFDSLDIISFQ